MRLVAALLLAEIADGFRNRGAMVLAISRGIGFGGVHFHRFRRNCDYYCRVVETIVVNDSRQPKRSK
jgi:hypothetical protein